MNIYVEKMKKYIKAEEVFKKEKSNYENFLLYDKYKNDKSDFILIFIMFSAFIFLSIGTVLCFKYAMGNHVLKAMGVGIFGIVMPSSLIAALFEPFLDAISELFSDKEYIKNYDVSNYKKIEEQLNELSNIFNSKEFYSEVMKHSHELNDQELEYINIKLKNFVDKRVKKENEILNNLELIQDETLEIENN